MHLPEDLPPDLRDHRDRNRDFPHDDTSDLQYSPEQFRAYQDLGTLIVGQMPDDARARVR